MATQSPQPPSRRSGDSNKLQQHLELLREQYVKLQKKHSDLEQKYSHAISTSGSVGPDHFVSRLLNLIADLYDKALYSDIDIVLGDRKISGHRFVLAARSRHWSQDETLASTQELDFSYMTPFVAGSMMRWVYTDSIILPSEQTAMIELLAASNKYHLNPLKEKCEQALISSVTVRNCIKLYQISEEHAAQKLKEYCLQIISSHWENLNTSDFAELSAPLLYEMFKAHTTFPLHLAIQHIREDVVFLFLIEHNAQLPLKLNEYDNEGNLPLNLALLSRHEEIANTLVSHNCDLDLLDPEGNSLLHLAILRGDSFAASFLIKKGANTMLARREKQETPLHMVAAYDPSQALTNVSSASVREAPWPSESMAQIASLLLEYHANPDSQDAEGCTPLQRAVGCKNEEVFTILLTNPVLNLDLRNHSGASALWLALQQLDASYLTSDDTNEFDHTFATRLIKRGSNVDSVDTRSGNCLLHRAALESNEAAAVFLVHHGAISNHKNLFGETPIHIAAKNGLHQLMKVLLENGADPNVQTALKPRPNPPALPPLSLSGASEHSMVDEAMGATSTHSIPSVATPPPSAGRASVIRQGSSGDFIGASVLSPSTLGALNALNFTSQATSGYSINAGSGYSSMVGAPTGGITGVGGRNSPAQNQRQGLNPFGSDSDDEEEESSAVSSGYHVTSQQYSRTTPDKEPAQLGGLRGMVPGGRNSPGLDSRMVPGGRNSPGFDSRMVPSGRNSPGFDSRRVSGGSARNSPALDSRGRGRSPSAVLPNMGSEVVEFIEPPQQFDISMDPGARTALHIAIAHSHPRVVDILLNHRATSGSGRLEIGLNLNLEDGHNETPLSLALWTEQFPIAQQLIKSGAGIECVDREEPGLLYVAILRELPFAAMFLLENGADCKKRTPQNESLLLLAVKHKLEMVADHLCEVLGSELSVADSKGNSPLWVALRSRQETIASKLVIHGCDPNAWHRTPDGTSLNLLHKAILLKDTTAACFLIRSGADINSCTRPSGRPGGGSEDLPMSPVGMGEGQFSSPLHMACERGLHEVVRCLMEHKANINAKDSMGQSALHVSISCKQTQCSDVLLSHADLDLTIKDKAGHTPFAKAMAARDDEAGRAILKREPKAAEQVDARGQNFLHLAVLNQDLEGVIFLLSVQVDINSKVQGPTHNTPLHYAIKSGLEILTRHLLLAGARVSDIDNHQRGPIHMSVEGDFHTILSVLLEHAADPDSVDENRNNGLHIALQLGHIGCARVLLEESNVNLLSVNARGENCLHLLAKYTRENAAAIFHMLIQVAPGFPINKQEGEGNTPLLLAYIGGSTVLCDALIKAGAHPGIPNKQGVSIFNTPVATKQLLFRVLDQIHTEPAWLEGNFCYNCSMKFNISHRKHHCRHCGRVLCKQCTAHQLPILKFDLSKPVRVCEVCSDSFRLLASR